MKSIRIFVITCLVLIKATLQQDKIGDFFVCGSNKPKTIDDCAIANLNSGFHCCLRTGDTQREDSCVLIADAARNTTMKNYQGPPFYQCSNFGEYFKFSLVLFAFLFLIL